MTKTLMALAATIILAAPAFAQDEPQGAPSPNEIVAQAAPVEWVTIAPEDLLVMTLAPDAAGKAREVVIQLMPPPFSQGWVDNIRTLARAGWYDDISVNRVQDNYVVQWGDPNGEDQAKAKPLPEGLRVMGEQAYLADDLLLIPDPRGRPRLNYTLGAMMIRNATIAAHGGLDVLDGLDQTLKSENPNPTEIEMPHLGDAYAPLASLLMGWPIAGEADTKDQVSKGFWPVHCYGMVGVGRGYSPDTGSGAELYTVIGHSPRHLDRNIALVGRIVAGMEHLSSLPRGSGDLGFYTEDEFDKRSPILTVRVASDLPKAEQPGFEYLSTEGETFAKYAEARANRRDPFFIAPAGGADICNIPVPVRRTAN